MFIKSLEIDYFHTVQCDSAASGQQSSVALGAADVKVEAQKIICW